MEPRNYARYDYHADVEVPLNVLPEDNIPPGLSDRERNVWCDGFEVGSGWMKWMIVRADNGGSLMGSLILGIFALIVGIAAGAWVW